MKRRSLSILLPWLGLLPVLMVGRAAHATPIAVHTVNSVLDRVDALPGNGLCVTAEGACTLRAAIQEASASPSLDTVVVPPGHYALTLGFNQPPEDAGLSGDLDITSTLTISGAGVGLTVIDGNGGITSDRALHIVGGTVTVTGVSVYNGHAQANGGGIHIESGAALNLSESAVHENRVSHASSAGGGGIYNQGYLTLTLSIVSLNVLNAPHAIGGGILHFGQSLVMISSTVSSNIAEGAVTGSGGGLFMGENTATIRASTLSGNAAKQGGGLYNTGGTLALVNSTVSSNQSTDSGSGLYTTGGQTQLRNATVAANVANSDGSGGGQGGVYHAGAGQLRLLQSIVAGNRKITAGGTLANSDCGGSIDAAGNNLLTDVADCTLTGNTPILASALLGPLADNGGPTQTHALLPGSPAINAGTSIQCTDAQLALLSTDQRGQPRPPAPDCDLGAYEFLTRLLVPLVLR